MPRIGKLPVAIPQGVIVSQENHYATVKDPKGKFKQYIGPRIEISIRDGEIALTRHSDGRQGHSLRGPYHQLIHDVVTGAHEEFVQTLKLAGVGYRTTDQGQILELSLGFTHAIYLVLLDKTRVETQMVHNQTPRIILESYDRQLLGQAYVKVRSFHEPEPYKGRDVHFLGKEIRHKSNRTTDK